MPFEFPCFLNWVRDKFQDSKPDWWESRWVCTVDLHEGVAHVIPTNDLLKCHEVSEDCPCGPWQELLTDHPADMPDVWMYTHQALDGRP